MLTDKNISDFSMSEVECLDKYCVNALEKDLDYLLSFDLDKLLAGFRETAGMDTKGVERYPGWESTLIGGHSLGHLLSAVAQAYINKGVKKADKEKAYSMLVALIDGLLECQANSKGKENFLFGAIIINPENVEQQFDNVEENKTNIMTQSWVPWYTMHKLLTGILDVYKFTGYENALVLAKRIGDWSYNRATGWDEATHAQVISVEYGGMNDALYELYSLTGEDKYAVVAHYFDSIKLFDQINEGGENALNNLHANTTIPKFIGALNRYKTCHGRVIDGKEVDASKYLEYAENFWDMVVERHTYATGGNSEWEHFGKDYILDKERTNCNCETCNIHNMLKMSKSLFCITGDVKYADYYENAFINTILSSQNPETGMATYFQPMSTGYFKVFGERFTKFWCCTGTGMENFTKLNDSIFFHDDEALIVNLYESAEVVWEEKKLRANLEADLLQKEEVKLSLSTTDGEPAMSAIYLRIPSWVAAKPAITINKEPFEYEIDNGYANIPAGLTSGSEIIIKLPMKLGFTSLPDSERSVAFKYGPFVLSANLGTQNMTTTTTGVMVTIPAEKLYGHDDLVLPDDVSAETFLSSCEKYFTVREDDFFGKVFTCKINQLEFAPHYLRYKERYGIYFAVRTEKELESIKKAKALANMERPEGKVLDSVQPGYGQYENDELHRMYDWGGSVGSTERGYSRYAKPGGSFTYHMCVAKGKENYLSLTFLKEDSGKTLKINSGDEVFFEDSVEYDGAEETFELRIKIPESIVNTAETVTANGEKHDVIPLTFRGSEGAMSARLCGLGTVLFE